MASDSQSEKGTTTRTPSSFGERVRLCRDLAGIGQQALASKVGVSLTTIQNYEGGQYPKGEIAVALAGALGCTLDWLLAGVGEIFDPARTRIEEFTCGSPCDAPLSRVVVTAPPLTPVVEAVKPEYIECMECQLTMVPMVEARLSAGTGSFETGASVERRYAFRSDWINAKGQPSKMVLMRVAGDSMEPQIFNNDTVLLDQSQTTPRAGGLFAIGVEDVVYIKMVDTLPGKIILKSFNPAYEPLEIDARGDLVDGIRIIGRAVWIGRELY